MNYIDITNNWVSFDGKGDFTILQEIYINRHLYKVGDNGVRQFHYQREIEIGRIIAEKYKHDVKLMPEITGNIRQQHITMPDFLIDDISFELKRIKGNGKATFYHAAINARKQSKNIIFDISRCPLNENVCINRIKDIYNNIYCSFVDICIIIKNKNILLVLKRK